MFVITAFNYSTILSVFGYSFLLKKILFRNSKIEIDNIDFFYGLILIIFISLFSNFFLPLKYLSLPIIILGLFFFFLGNYFAKYNFNYFLVLLIIFILTFISFYNGDNVDSPMYHLQILKWMQLHKIAFGLANLEIRFGTNFSWHSFIGLVEIDYKNFSSKYFLSNLVLTVFLIEVLNNKNFTLSSLFLYLACFFLLFFSYIHPFKNGVILNHLGNPEVDIVAMIFFFFSVYVFLKIIENNFNQKKDIYSLIFIIFISITTKLSNISLIFLLIYIYIKNNYNFFNLANYFIIFTGLLWLIRSFFLSGCLVFPIKSTCIKTEWNLDLSKIEFYKNVVSGYARDTRLRDRYLDFDYTINSYDWIGPWFKDYFLHTSLLKISSMLFLISMTFICILMIKRKADFKKYMNFDFCIILILFISTILIWFKAPEIRFGWGIIISLPCFFIAILIFELNFINKKIFNFNFVSVLFLLFLLFSKNFNFFNLSNLIESNKKHNYNQILKVGKFNGENIFISKNHKCYDFPEICVNPPKKKYDIKNLYMYKLYMSN